MFMEWEGIFGIHLSGVGSFNRGPVSHRLDTNVHASHEEVLLGPSPEEPYGAQNMEDSLL